MLDRKLASKEIPLLNQLEHSGKCFISESDRAEEDDRVIIYDAGGSIRGRTHISPAEFDKIYQSVMRFFTEQEKYSFKQYQTGEKKPDEFFRDCAMYLKRNFPNAMNN